MPFHAPDQSSNQTQKSLRSALDNSTDLVMITNREGIIEYVNPVFEHVTGYLVAEVAGRLPTILKSDFQESCFYGHMWETISSGQTFRDIFINRKKDGTFYEELKTISPVLDDWGDISHFVSSGRVLSEGVEIDERFRRIGGFDELTGLPERIAMCRMLEQSLERLVKLGQEALMVYVDLDNFSSVNAGVGYPTGDQILLQFAARLRACALPGDLVARVGADDFCLLLAGRGARGSEADAMLAALRDRLEQPFKVDGKQYYLSCSVGAVFFPTQGHNGDMLFKRAEIALREAKALGGSQVAYYTPNREQHDARSLSLVSKLFTALEHEQFELHYQPQVTLPTADICGVEALLRWRPKSGQCQGA